ncbi:hypothetical protein Clacol_009547 [Clathrus columnatus]|uniref:Uncharacterized protein n=1 Tax=Clathrus columnatus TaxID=1419009 RepID=A0AAV5AKS9_9AGAM|nr:hypothetical protein Clacol_009547 [Clathrus columnatus]
MSLYVETLQKATRVLQEENAIPPEELSRTLSLLTLTPKLTYYRAEMLLHQVAAQDILNKIKELAIETEQTQLWKSFVDAQRGLAQTYNGMSAMGASIYRERELEMNDFTTIALGIKNYCETLKIMKHDAIAGHRLHNLVVDGLLECRMLGQIGLHVLEQQNITLVDIGLSYAFVDMDNYY